MTALATPPLAPVRRLDPVADRDHAEVAPLQIASAKRIECAACAKVFIFSVIVLGEVESAAPRQDGYMRTCHIYCDHCNHVQTWQQACDADGTLHSGLPLSKPGFLKGRAVARFLRKHPQAAGVGQI